MDENDKWTRALIFWEIGFVVLIIVCVGFTVVFASRNSSYTRLTAQQTVRNVALENRIDKEQKALNAAAYNRAINNASPQVKMNIKQINASEEANDKVNELFKIMLTYSSSKEFNSRAEQAKNLVSSNILANQNLFGTDLDDGSHFVDNSGLHSVFLSADISAGLLKGNKLPLIIKANSLSWYTDQNHAQTADIYIATYDYTQRKFTELRLLNNLFRGNSSARMN